MQRRMKQKKVRMQQKKTSVRKMSRRQRLGRKKSDEEKGEEGGDDEGDYKPAYASESADQDNEDLDQAGSWSGGSAVFLPVFPGDRPDGSEDCYIPPNSLRNICKKAGLELDHAPQVGRGSGMIDDEDLFALSAVRNIAVVASTGAQTTPGKKHVAAMAFEFRDAIWHRRFHLTERLELAVLRRAVLEPYSVLPYKQGHKCRSVGSGTQVLESEWYTGETQSWFRRRLQREDIQILNVERIRMPNPSKDASKDSAGVRIWFHLLSLKTLADAYSQDKDQFHTISWETFYRRGVGL
ncbi:unnamed protein product [Amoebophrya sp. A25]|nr:unnamed protein product [Amoebophrya sp. A25]|eukprot:GSA25T00026731001.1